MGSNPIQLFIINLKYGGNTELTDNDQLNGASMGKLLYPFKIGNERLSGESLAMAA